MTTDPHPPEGPDLAAGVALAALPESQPLLGHVAAQPVILVRRGDTVFAVGALCPHRNGRLVDGLVVDETIRCPLHHACFSLRTGAHLRPPALAALPRFAVRQRDGMVRVEPEPEPQARPRAVAPGAERPAPPAAITIVGAGAAGQAAAQALREAGFAGRLTLLGADASLPYDRTSLSKEFLAGDKAAEALPLQPAAYYREHQIDVRQGARVASLDLAGRRLTLASMQSFAFDALLLATGSEAIRPELPGSGLPHVFTLRSLAQCQNLVGAARAASRAVVVGASFIAMEAAAALRARGLEVHVVAPDDVPMRRGLGLTMGRMLQRQHEARGVHFHLGQSVAAIDAAQVTLDGGGALPADLVLLGVGVKPSIELARGAGLPCEDHGVVVDETLQTAAPGIYAAGDICRWPAAHGGGMQRIEHWALAQRQGQVAALNMLGARRPFDAVPFFWTRQFGRSVGLVGFAAGHERTTVYGDVDGGAGAVAFWRGDAVVAVATVGLGRLRLQCELALEQRAQPRLRALLEAV